MATTAGWTMPMRPVGRYGQEGQRGTVVPLDPGITVSAGDIITVDSGTKDAQVITNNDIVLGTHYVLGIALINENAAITAANPIDRDAQPGPFVSPSATTWHSINVALATPGTLFEGNIIDGASDQDGVYAEDVRTAYGLLDSADGFACINKGDAADEVVFTFGYATPQTNVQTGAQVFGVTAGVGLKNPRVRFTFLTGATVFGASS